MFGKNPVAKREETDGSVLRVVAGSPFYTIQGEGPHAGMPAVFLRLHGCPLRCFFCDTQFSDPSDPSMDVEDIWDAIKGLTKFDRRLKPLVVVTGGEPTRQDLTPLVTRITDAGYRVQIETAGIFWQPWMEWIDRVDVVVSPKTPNIDPQVWQWARAFKYVIQRDSIDPNDGLPNRSTQKEGAVALVCRPRLGAEVYLSPMDEYDPVKNAKNAAAVAQVAMHFGYRAGLQLHKFMAVP